jgi:hypothetical protein
VNGNTRLSEWSRTLHRLRGNTYIEAGRKVVGERERALLKTLLCVVEEKAEAAGRIKAEEKIAKSITEVMTRIDDKEGRNVGRGISEKWEGGVQCGHTIERRTPDTSSRPLSPKILLALRQPFDCYFGNSFKKAVKLFCLPRQKSQFAVIYF